MYKITFIWDKLLLYIRFLLYFECCLKDALNNSCTVFKLCWATLNSPPTETSQRKDNPGFHRDHRHHREDPPISSLPARARQARWFSAQFGFFFSKNPLILCSYFLVNTIFLQAEATDRVPVGGVAGGRVAPGPGVPLQMGLRRGRLQSTGTVSLSLV